MIVLLLALIYLAFISMGLPDSVLGAAWPVLSVELDVPVSGMGLISIIISGGTIVSSLFSNRIAQLLSVHKITSISIAITAFSLLGFALSPNFYILCLFAVPYGLGAGSIDAALNNYVAVNFESRHVSWVHCMWGVGTTIGPYIMGMALTNNMGYRTGYNILFVMQLSLSVIMFISAPLWKRKVIESDATTHGKLLSLKQIFSIRGVPFIAVAFFCFSVVEATSGAWASTYLVYIRDIDREVAAGFTSFFYLGITVGRAAGGFATLKFNDRQMIRAGSVIMVVGVMLLLLPQDSTFALLGLMVIGLGSAPIFPCIIHSTPTNFGVENSQALTGVQMACAYTGSMTMPALFGVIGDKIGFGIYPFFVLLFIILMTIMHELLIKKIGKVDL